MKPISPPYLAGNVTAWQQHAAEYVAAAEKAWAANEAYWGIWEYPEEELKLLPAALVGRDAVELGCGAAYVSAWLHRRGARVTGIDPAPNQMATARRLRDRYAYDIRLTECAAEQLPFDDASFDFAISEYGACLWSDPYLWVPEVARVLRPGGQLAFLTSSALSTMCLPDNEAEGPWTRTLRRPYFGMHATRWPDTPEETEFHLPHGAWIDLLRASGFDIERLVEIQAPNGASSRFAWAEPGWAGQWPSEEVWVARKRA